MPTLKLANDEIERSITLSTGGLFIINGWTVAITHEDMKAYLKQYTQGNGVARLNPGNGFFRDEINDDAIDQHKNGILTHNGAKMAFHSGEFDQVINWLAKEYEKLVEEPKHTVVDKKHLPYRKLNIFQRLMRKLRLSC